MSIKKLSTRLQAVADLVQGDIIADIGSDHAYLPAWLALNNKIKKAYAVDISAACVERIKANLEKFGISRDIIEPVLSDGFAELEHIKLTDIIIAGMGGENIAGIMGGIKNPAGINFILQPNTKTEFLKNYLLNNNYRILDEVRVDEKRRYYNIMRAVYGYILF